MNACGRDVVFRIRRCCVQDEVMGVCSGALWRILETKTAGVDGGVVIGNTEDREEFEANSEPEVLQ